MKYGNNDSDNTILGKMFSIKADLENDVIKYLIYNDLGDWYRDTFGLTETSKRITNISCEIIYKGVKVDAKLECDVKNDIEKRELCLTGKIKFKFLGQPVVISLDKTCDEY